jgi:hypothetical protein
MLIVTHLVLQGPVAQYGRGVVGDVASQLTAQFADAVRERVANRNTDTAGTAGDQSRPPA